jgi:hypothetical protein
MSAFSSIHDPWLPPSCRIVGRLIAVLVPRGLLVEGSDENDIKALTRSEIGVTFLEEALSNDLRNTIKMQS